MIYRIKEIVPEDDYVLAVTFDQGEKVRYDLKEDMGLPGYDALKTTYGLYPQVKLDESRTCIYWNDEIDLPSDTIYEYGKRIE